GVADPAPPVGRPIERQVHRRRGRDRRSGPRKCGGLPCIEYVHRTAPVADTGNGPQRRSTSGHRLYGARNHRGVTLRMARPQVLVHPQFNALYYSYFLQGLRDLYGAASVRTTLDGFPDLGHDCLAIRLRDGQRERRIYIHAHDSPSLPPEAIEWADVFGKVNLDPGQVPPNASTRIVPTGPVFPVRLWSPIVTGALA